MFPAIFLRRNNLLGELSVFIDESGDFGPYDYRSPYYIITMVFHDQSNDISAPIAKLDQDLSYRGFKDHCVHTGPIIRRENEYEFVSVNTRRSLFNSMVTFIKHCDIKYHSFHIEKRQFDDSVQAAQRLSLLIFRFVKDHLIEFFSYDKVKIYYDNGQVEVSKILVTVFTVLLQNVEIKRVTPSDYRLFQAADLFCSMELVKLKIESSTVSASETEFFGNMRDLKKNYIKPLSKYEWK